ncbi:hypothetical protein IWQ62_002440 [Dispira parvispora]|uniref:SprT-like domain-containing protein n=1 Tax=Dispira parvispora TaxID=1520584 RepID=A0A9W8E3V1_9FUNG|nr:hypothetical protein IWQ62_002440 [Dispira parvispora]
MLTPLSLPESTSSEEWYSAESSCESPSVGCSPVIRQPRSRRRYIILTDEDSDSDGGDCRPVSPSSLLATNRTKPGCQEIIVLSSDDASPEDIDNAVESPTLHDPPLPKHSSPIGRIIRPNLRRLDRRRIILKASSSNLNPNHTNVLIPLSSPHAALGKESEFDILYHQALTNFRRYRDVLAQALYHRFNATVFDHRVILDGPIRWSTTLNKTAGRTHCGWVTKGKERKCWIELATKVVDSVARLQETLLHELCHGAVWMVDGSRESHGPLFRKWAQRASRQWPTIPVTTRHSYDINYKFKYVCASSHCGIVYGRHSKSIDTTRQVCGKCKGRLVLTNRRGEQVTKRTLNPYQQFVKTHYRTVQQQYPGLSHQQIMKRVATLYKTKDVDEVATTLNQIALN